MNLEKLSDAELFGLFKNANRMLSRGPNIQVDSVIAEIEREWKNRSKMVRAGVHEYTSPQEGMLATLGYHVGNQNGERTPVRCLILKKVIERELPLVQSPAYTDEWGPPKSSKRYHKLVRVIESQLSNSRHNSMPNMERSMIEWSEDLDWVRQQSCPHWEQRMSAVALFAHSERAAARQLLGEDRTFLLRARNVEDDPKAIISARVKTIYRRLR